MPIRPRTRSPASTTRLGLGLRYVEKSGTVQATLSGGLKDGEKLYIRVRRGKMTLTSQKDLDCSALAQARPLAGSGERELTGKIVYQGPKVDKSIFDLAKLYDDARWATGDVPQSVKDDVAKYGPDPIVEACVMAGDKVHAKLATNLAYAWDQGTKAEATLAKLSANIHFQAADAGLEGDASRRRIRTAFRTTRGPCSRATARAADRSTKRTSRARSSTASSACRSSARSRSSRSAAKASTTRSTAAISSARTATPRPARSRASKAR